MIPLAVSYGVGVDSTAVLLEFHSLGIRPDLILFADTGGEKPSTYEYLNKVMQPWLWEVGFPQVEVVRRNPTENSRGRYETLEQQCRVNRTLPSLAFGGRKCSHKWKHEPMHAFMRTWEPALACWGHGGRVRKVIGYDCGVADSRRPHIPDDEDYVYWYPLREWGWDREMCIDRIRQEGLQVPEKSSCFFCPAMKPWEVRELPPEQLRRIIEIEAAAEPRQLERLAAQQKSIVGLWGRGTKGRRGAIKRPGSMTEFIVGEGLLPEFTEDPPGETPWWLRPGEQPWPERRFIIESWAERLREHTSLPKKTQGEMVFN